MIIQVMTIFVVPVFQAIWREKAVRRMNKQKHQINLLEDE
jgi:hypothetical protein